MYKLINMASKATKRPWQKAPFIAANAQHVRRLMRRFTSKEALACLAFTDTELRAVLTVLIFVLYSNWMNKWIVIFLFVFCVFVQRVLINLLDNSEDARFLFLSSADEWPGWVEEALGFNLPRWLDWLDLARYLMFTALRSTFFMSLQLMWSEAEIATPV